jgi:Holliday junction resolvase RusA-like endonuclease
MFELCTEGRDDEEVLSSVFGLHGPVSAEQEGERVTIMQIEFEVFGVPIPKGSTKAFFRPGMKYPIVTADNLRTKPWANTVTLIAQQHAPAGGPWQGPVDLTVWFTLPRPKSLPKKVVDHVKKPDLDKLLRTIKDSLKGVIYADDAQVVHVNARKTYENHLSVPGVRIRLEGGSPLSL